MRYKILETGDFKLMFEEFSLIPLRTGEMTIEEVKLLMNPFIEDQDAKNEALKKSKLLKSPEKGFSWKDFCTSKNTIPFEFNRDRCGITTGPYNRIIGLDIDNSSKFDSFMQKNGHSPLPETFTVTTGKGLHLYFLWPDDGWDYRCTSDEENGFDVRANGGYLVAPGSKHPLGSTYSVKVAAPFAPAPDWLLAYIRERNAKKTSSGRIEGPVKYQSDESAEVLKKSCPEAVQLNAELKQLVEQDVPHGMRSTESFKVMKLLIGQGYTDDEIKIIYDTYPIGKKCRERGLQYFYNELTNAREYLKRSRVSIEDPKPNSPAVKFKTIDLINLLSGLEYFRTIENEYFARCTDNAGNTIYYPFLSSDFEGYILRRVIDQYHTTPSDSMLKQAMKVIKSDISTSAKEIRKVNRFATDSEALYYNIADGLNGCIKITKHGYGLDRKPDYIFARNTFITPITGIKADMSGLTNTHNLLHALGIENENLKHYLIINLVSYLFDYVSTPILYLYGNPGSGKTTLAKALKNIFDPMPAGHTEPYDTKSLSIYLNKSGVGFRDNFSSLPKKIQDVFCESYSGGLHEIKVLYTVDDMKNLQLKCPMIFASVSIPPNLNEDFISRTTFVKVSKKKITFTDTEVTTMLERAYPYVRGELFWLASEILKIKDRFHATEIGRHNDFDVLGQAYFSIIGKESSAYEPMMKEIQAGNVKALISSIELKTFAKMVLTNGILPFTMKDLSETLVKEIDDDDIEKIDPRVLGKAIKKVVPYLSQLGINVYTGSKDTISGTRAYVAVTHEYMNLNRLHHNELLIKTNVNKIYNDSKH